MTEEIEKDGKKYYKCEQCGLVYSDKEMAERCQRWCSEHKSCNLEIIKHAVKDFAGIG